MATRCAIGHGMPSVAAEQMDDRTDVSNKSFGDQEQRYMKSLSKLIIVVASYPLQLSMMIQMNWKPYRKVTLFY